MLPSSPYTVRSQISIEASAGEMAALAVMHETAFPDRGKFAQDCHSVRWTITILGRWGSQNAVRPIPVADNLPVSHKPACVRDNFLALSCC
jgi:hypothetical protein